MMTRGDVAAALDYQDRLRAELVRAAKRKPRRARLRAWIRYQWNERTAL